MRRALGLLIAATAAAGAIVVLRRRSTAAAVRADLYFADGSMLSLDDDAPEIDGLMRAARAALGAR
ncbi:MAG: hypothetical protein WCN97_07490 [Thermoleophilia bacterium]